jgi:hypothetical protein
LGHFSEIFPVYTDFISVTGTLLRRACSNEKHRKYWAFQVQFWKSGRIFTEISVFRRFFSIQNRTRISSICMVITKMFITF